MRKSELESGREPIAQGQSGDTVYLATGRQDGHWSLRPVGCDVHQNDMNDGCESTPPPEAVADLTQWRGIFYFQSQPTCQARTYRSVLEGLNDVRAAR